MNTRKMYDNSLTILTPSYNRGHTLPKLYTSLKSQTNTNFTWLVIDDGSTDDTRNLINKWSVEETKFRIQYKYKENGGKHTALNLGIEIIHTDLIFIVDSDDYLLENAVDNILEQWCRIKENNSIAGIGFLRGYSSEKVIGSKFPYEGIYNEIDMRCKYHVSGDKAEVWRTQILKKYKFPVFEGEKFQGENYIWSQIAFKYQMLFINKIIYITEYLEGGLTKSGRKLRISCPLGGMENSKVGMNEKFPLNHRIKCGILYNCYAFFANYTINKRIKNGEQYIGIISLTILPGFFLFLCWKKYLE